MAKIYDLSAHRAAGPAQEAPLTRNQQILAVIRAMLAARTPEEILEDDIRGTEEELQEVQRRYSRLLEARKRLPSPADIAKSKNGPEPSLPDRDGGRGR